MLDPSPTPSESDWEWIYEEATVGASATSKKRKAAEAFLGKDSRRIVGAKKGEEILRLGDAVLLKAARNDQWVAMLYEFLEDEDGDEKEAKFMWFTSPKDISRLKRRSDAMSNEIYLTAEFDDNSLNTVLSKANVCSVQALKARYPNGKIPRSSQDNGRTFVCRRGVDARTASFTEEFVWEGVYRSLDDLEVLRNRIKRETQLTRIHKPMPSYKSYRPRGELDDFIVVDDDEDDDDKENGPKTPRKKPRVDFDLTPRSEAKKGMGSKQTPRKYAPSAAAPSVYGTPTKQHITPRQYTTPTHKRIVAKKPLEFTPLGTRILDTESVLSSPYQLARSHLHVSSVPLALPCRDSEFAQVYSHLSSAIIDGTGSCIYISGMPGTGKTATVREVIAQLNASVAAGEIDDFLFVEINGMKVTDPHQSYSLLWEALRGERLSPTHALSLLEREFSTPSPRRVPCVVLMDELDQLVTKNQSVMYNFFNWPSLRHSRLIVLAVANTMDLPERTLSNKISSRLGLTRITFQSYTHEQLITIIGSRLQGVSGGIVESDAIQFASRKVAQVSGDARRALDICRRAVEIAELEAAEDEVSAETPSKAGRACKGESRGLVTIATVQRAIREATSTPLQQFLRCCPLASKVFLAAILARVRRTGVGECLLGEVVEEAKRLGAMSQLDPVHEILLCEGGKRAMMVPRILAMGTAATGLAEGGAIMVESRKGERTAKVRLIVSEEDVRLALKDDMDVRGLGFASS